MNLTADVCIVGAGAAGITLALALRGSGLSVLLLESATVDGDAAVQSLYEGSRSGITTWRLDETRMRAFGGSTTAWAGYCRPLSAEDFEPRAWIPESGWPIDLAELDPYYRLAHRTLEIGDYDYDVGSLSRSTGFPLLGFTGGAVESRFYRFSPVRFGERYREELEAAPDIHTMTSANLLAVRLTGRGGRVSHLACGTLDGTRFTVEASRYVLALGGIENARLLLVSNAEHEEGIANGSGLVGQFMEHPHYYQKVTILWRDRPDLRFYERHLPAHGVAVQGALALSAEVRRAEHLPSFTATLEDHGETSTDGPIVPATAAALLPPAPGGASGTSALTLRCEQTRTATSRITLLGARDVLGMPKIDLAWELRHEDRVGLHRCCEILGRELGRLGLGRLRAPAATDLDAWLPLPGGHHLGTTRMSDDPRRGVVNADGRAHDVDNLYLAGSSVFTTGGDANPTLSIVALAHRLAEHLR